MPTIRPVSDLRNYNEVLRHIEPGSPVYLTKNGRGRYVIQNADDYDRDLAIKKLLHELEKGRISGETQGWLTHEEVTANLRALR